MIEAVVFVGFVVLAIACIAIFGPIGAVVWLLCYGCFLAICRGLLAFIGDPDDALMSEHRATVPRPVTPLTPASANTTRPTPSPPEAPF